MNSLHTIEALDKRFDQVMDRYDMKFYVTNESVLDAPVAVGNFFKRCILLLDDYVNGIIDILHEKARQKEILRYVHALRSYREYFNKNPIWHKYCPHMETKDPNYLSEILLSMSRLMYTEADYIDMDKYVKGYMEDIVRGTKDTDILMVTYDDLCQSVNNWLKTSEDRIQDIRKRMRNFSLAWKETNGKTLHQTTVAKLFRMAKSACKEIALSTMYDLGVFRLYTCRMFTQAISDKERESVRNYEKLTARKQMNLEKKSPVVATYNFGDLEIKVHELPVLSATAYNRDGTDVFVDQQFKEYPRAVQKAIIYHEIGHLANGHFGTLDTKNDTVDARRLAYQVKKYKRMVAHSVFKEDMDDDELIYIMVESEADRYASKFVGKKTVDASLKIRMDRHLIASIPEDLNNITDVEICQIAYNQERNRFRAALG